MISWKTLSLGAIAILSASALTACSLWPPGTSDTEPLDNGDAYGTIQVISMVGGRESSVPEDQAALAGNTVQVATNVSPDVGDDQAVEADSDEGEVLENPLLQKLSDALIRADEDIDEDTGSERDILREADDLQSCEKQIMELPSPQL